MAAAPVSYVIPRQSERASHAALHSASVRPNCSLPLTLSVVPPFPRHPPPPTDVYVCWADVPTASARMRAALLAIFLLLGQLFWY